MIPAAARRCLTANASSGVGCWRGSRCTRIPAPASTRAASSANSSDRCRASQPMTTPASAASGPAMPRPAPVSHRASAAVVPRTTARFIRFGPAPTAPRSPAVPNSSRRRTCRPAPPRACGLSSPARASSSARSRSSGSSASHAVSRARRSSLITSARPRAGRAAGPRPAARRPGPRRPSRPRPPRRGRARRAFRPMRQARGQVGHQRDGRAPRRPRWRAAIASSTVDMPTRSAPSVRSIRISAGVS